MKKIFIILILILSCTVIFGQKELSGFYKLEKKVVLDTILKEFKVKKDKNFRETIKYLWENNLRIPQEVITYEVLKGEYNI